MTLSKKTIFLTILGNVLEYYEFLLFAHLSFIITPLFFPYLDPATAHLVGLLLFGLAFVTRPIGGYFFGKFADKNGRKQALIATVFLGMIPALGLALLPTYSAIGIAATLLFIFFRLWQGIALGGEYTTAGTYLMEQTTRHRGLISGMLCGSGQIGGLAGLGIAYLCLQENTPDMLWRAAFLLGAIGSFISYRLRYLMIDTPLPIKIQTPITPTIKSIGFNRTLTVLVGAVVSVSVFLPSTYTNFYLTKVLNYDSSVGVGATCIALVGYMVLCVCFGRVADRVGHIRLMRYAALIACPLSILFFYLLMLGYFWQAQIGLTLLAASFGAPIHVLMNQLYPQKSRAFNVAFFFMLGTSIGGLTPYLSGYLVHLTDYHLIPAFFLSLMMLTVYFVLTSCNKRLLASSP